MIHGIFTKIPLEELEIAKIPPAKLKFHKCPSLKIKPAQLP